MLKLNDKVERLISIPVFHCSNIDGTYICDDDLINQEIDYRSINGDPYLCWNNDSQKLIRENKLIIFPREMVIYPKTRIQGIHEALGHVDSRTAKRSINLEYIDVMEDETCIVNEKCITCQLAKAKRCDHKRDSRSKYTITIPFYVMHSDLMYVGDEDRPEESYVPDHMGYHHWVLTFTCDYTKMTYCFPLKSKNEVCKTFKTLRAYIRNTFELNICILHTDQGTEYNNDDMKTFMRENGITHFTTSSYSSVENGVAERKNLTIRNDYRANLEASGLPDVYWTFALDYTVSIRNKISRNGTSPEEMVMKYCYPNQNTKQIYTHKYKSFGRLGIYLDLTSKKSSVARKALYCFYLGPSQVPMSEMNAVLGGDRVVVYKMDETGYHRPILTSSTNVTYVEPLKLFKDTKLESLDLKIPPIYKSPSNVFGKQLPKWDANNQMDIPGTGIIDFSINDKTNDIVLYDKLPRDDNQSSIEDYSHLRGDHTLSKDQIQHDKSAVENLQKNIEVRGDATIHDDDRIEKTLTTVENNSYIESTNTPRDITQIENEIYSNEKILSNIDDIQEIGMKDIDDGVNLPLSENQNETDLDSVDIGTEDLQRWKETENSLRSDTIEDILTKTNEKLNVYEVDKSLLPTGKTQEYITLPEGRALRSKVRISGIKVAAMKFVNNLSREPNRLPEPQRLIYSIISKDPIEGPGWIAAFNSEWESHISNKSWLNDSIYTSDPKILNKTVKLDVICNLKRASEGQPQKKKVRFVLRGDRQDESTYSKTYSPTLPSDILRIILAECVQSNRYNVFLDISTAYLNATIDHEIYVELPMSLEGKRPVRPGEKVVHRVNKAIYGLKQSGRLWYLRLTTFLKTLGFEERGDIQCVLVKPRVDTDGNMKISMIIGFFVDDMIVTGDSEQDIEDFIEKLNKEFKLKVTKQDANGFRDILGIAVKERRDKNAKKLLSIDLSMSQYIKKMIIKLGLEKDFSKSRDLSTPMTPGFQFDLEAETLELTPEELAKETHWMREVVGSLQYLANAQRPDLAFAANYMSRFCLFPHEKLKNELIRILRYTYKTRNLVIRYTAYESDLKQMKSRLLTYSDADHAGDITSRKSTLSAIFMMNGGPIAWFARVARFAATSSTDAEVAAMVEAGNGLTHYREVLSFLHILSPEYSRRKEYYPDLESEYAMLRSQRTGGVYEELSLEPLVIFVDNSAAIYLSQKGSTSGKTKHMAIRVARSNDLMENDHIEYRHIGTKDMLADILTKPVSAEVMKRLLPRILLDQEPVVKNIGGVLIDKNKRQYTVYYR